MEKRTKRDQKTPPVGFSPLSRSPHTHSRSHCHRAAAVHPLFPLPPMIAPSSVTGLRCQGVPKGGVSNHGQDLCSCCSIPRTAKGSTFPHTAGLGGAQAEGKSVYRREVAESAIPRAEELRRILPDGRGGQMSPLPALPARCLAPLFVTVFLLPPSLLSMSFFLLATSPSLPFCYPPFIYPTCRFSFLRERRRRLKRV